MSERRLREDAARELHALGQDVDALAAALGDIRARLRTLELLLAPDPPTELALPPSLEGDGGEPGESAVPPEHHAPDPEQLLEESLDTCYHEPPPLSDVPLLDFPDLYPWQSDAMEAWFADGRIGVVEAVTGAGKTRLGLAAMVDALERGRRVVIMVPTLALVEQWVRQVREMFPGIVISKDAVRSPGWHVLIDTVQTLARTNPLWRSEPALLIADEVHRYGAPTFSRALRPGFVERLGLTATYERGDDGDDILSTYFREVSFTLGYGRALADGIIAPFRIAHVGIELTEAERDEYEAASNTLKRSLWALKAVGDAPAGADFIDMLRYAQRVSNQPRHRGCQSARTFLTAFTRRREVLAGASGKVAALTALAPAVASSNGTIVFTQTTASAHSAANALQEAGCASVAVHGQLDDIDREERLELFREGRVTSTSAPRVLDEGIDVPAADLGIIVAASRSRRQMIQRLGRVIRLKDDGRSARCVILYALGTVEDPGVEEVPEHLAEIFEHAEVVERFVLPTDTGELLVALRPPLPVT